MKALKTTLLIFSYLLQYITPIALFGLVIPFTHGEIKAGLTGTGIVALCIIAVMLYGKIKEKASTHLHGAVRAIVLSIFPIAIWLIAGIGIKKLMMFINSLIDYWWIAFIFIILGRLVYIVSEALTVAEDING